jgi:hypothetical protein
MYSRAIGNGRCDHASIVAIHAHGSSSEAEVSADLMLGQLAVSVISQKENPVGPGCERKRMPP